MMEDGRVGNEELLVARNNERCGKICRRMRFMSKNEE